MSKHDTPRGTGLVAADEGPDTSLFGALLFGSLLSGNSVVTCILQARQPLGQLLCRTLHAAGVPRAVLEPAPPQARVESLAEGPVHFAAVDLDLTHIRALYWAMGPTREEAGQWWLKALISMNGDPRPGEPGFLRLFAHLKAITIRTLRHGTALELM